MAGRSISAHALARLSSSSPSSTLPAAATTSSLLSRSSSPSIILPPAPSSLLPSSRSATSPLLRSPASGLRACSPAPASSALFSSSSSPRNAVGVGRRPSHALQGSGSRSGSGSSFLRAWEEAKRYAGTTTPHTQVTTLANGLRVATQKLDSPWCSLGLILPFGARYENDDTRGHSYFIEKLAYKGSKNRTQEELMKEIESIGGTFATNLNRESLLYMCSAFQEDVERAVSILADVSLSPSYTKEDLEPQLAIAEDVLENITDNHAMLLPELAHKAAFGDSSLGHSLLCPAERLQAIHPQGLHETHARFFHPSRMVLAGAGIDHHVLVRLAEKYFVTDAPALPAVESVWAKYVAGDERILMAESPTRNALQIPLSQLCFAFPGSAWGTPELFPATVLQVLLGGGDSFSAGGPGKGMYSRFYTNVLNNYNWLQSTVAVHLSYADTGLFTINCSCPPEKVLDAANVVLAELLTVTHYLQPIELQRAQNMLKSMLAMNLESLPMICEDIARQILYSGKRMEADELCTAIDAVREQDVRDTLRGMLRAGLSIGAFGKLDGLPLQTDFQKVIEESLGRLERFAHARS